MKWILTQFKLNNNSKQVIRKMWEPILWSRHQYDRRIRIPIGKGRNFAIETNFAYGLEKLINLITRSEYKRQYIVSTKNRLHQCSTLYESQIRNTNLRTVPICKHIEICASNSFLKFTTYPQENPKRVITWMNASKKKCTS